LKKALFIILGVLLIDQSIKIWIKTHMYLGQAHQVTGTWFYLHFVENPGMAFGLTIGEGAWGKLLLSLFRLAAVAGIGYYLWTLSKKKVRPLLMVCVALIFAGALGNILDSVFYGKIFESSDPYDQNVAKVFPKQGYDGFLHGQVVDMFYFPVWHGNYPGWFPQETNEQLHINENVPGWVPRANESFTFFSPVFNIADAAISVGVFLLIVFQRRLFGKQTQPLSRRRVLVTNIFFSIVAFLISTFLLLTYFTLVSDIHPLPSIKVSIVLVLAAALGLGMFDMLRRWPVFIPEVAEEKSNEEIVAESTLEPPAETPEAPAETSESTEKSASDNPTSL
jgi:signal peptidase II